MRILFFVFSEGPFVQGSVVHHPEQDRRRPVEPVPLPQGGALLVRQGGVPVRRRGSRQAHGARH